jgi:hypothetical protein
MTTFVDLYFPLGLEMDRDEIQDAIEREMDEAVEVVGAGVGTTGSHIDLEVRGSIDQVVNRLAGTLRRLGVPESTRIVVSDPGTTLTLADVAPSLNE